MRGGALEVFISPDEGAWKGALMTRPATSYDAGAGTRLGASLQRLVRWDLCPDTKVQFRVEKVFLTREIEICETRIELKPPARSLVETIHVV